MWVVREVRRLFNEAVNCNSSLLAKHIKIKLYRTIILSAVLYGCETWFSALRDERRLGCLKIGCRGECLDLRETRKQESEERHIMRGLVICTAHPILFG